MVYKAPVPANGGRLAFLNERARFGFLAGQDFSWCPDFWPYDDVYVMAMPLYTPCVTVEPSEVYAELTSYVTDAFAAHNCGLTPEGRLVVLDGGEYWNHTVSAAT